MAVVDDSDWPNRKVYEYTGAMRWRRHWFWPVLEQEVREQSYEGDDLMYETVKWVPIQWQ